MEDCYRVFVGGLFPTVKEEDLRDRFGSFGEVKDVALIQRKTDGFVSKTFGYVTLKTTLQKLNKCFALFGGTKWNGHDLKVQLAKEDFMARLEKEWREPEKPKKLNKRKIVQPTKTYDEILKSSAKMKKALPGTLIEGEKNWVIGKYGRPLPVVYIKNLTSKKLLKVDPSKYCHCLRKINLDVDERSIEQLLWSLDDEKINDTQKKKKKNKQEVLQNGSPKKQKELFIADAVEAPIKNPSIQEKEAIDLKTPAKKMNVDDSNECTQLMKKTKGKKLIPAEKNNDNQTKNFIPENYFVGKEKDQVDFLHLTTGNDTKINKITELKTDISKTIHSKANDAKTPSLSSIESCEKMFEQCQLSHSIVSQLVRNNFNSQINVEPNNTPTSISNDDTDSDEDGDEDVCFGVNPFDFNFDSLFAINKGCSKMSSNFPTHPQSTEINKAQSIDNRSKRSSDVNKNDKKKLTKNEKHAFSDQQRLLALERKNKSVGKCKDLIKQALENVDSNLSTHIKFEDEEDQEDFKNLEKKDVDQQNKKFNLFGSDEESSDENDLFRLKPQFQGEEGEKLFKLHQKFSTDQRFKLDERFTEEKYDHIAKDEHILSDTQRSDALENDLKKEKEKNLSVLESVLGISLESDRKKKTLNNFRLDRYDPSNKDKSKYEYQISTDEVKSLSSEDEEQNNPNVLSPSTQPPLVSKETFYKVDESLKDLFQGKSKDSVTFTFLGLSADNNNEIKNGNIDGSGFASEKKQLSWKKALDAEKNLDDSKDTHLVQHTDLVYEKERFFFVTDDDRFKLGETFVRSSTEEEINQQWIGIRSKLHEAYKKNHKDALRRKFKHRKKF